MFQDDFKEDIQNFISQIKDSSIDQNEVKKTYKNLVKKYHPDSAPQNYKTVYNDYMILINKIYSEGKSAVKEVIIDEKINQKNEQTQAFEAFFNFQGNKPKPKPVYTITNYFGKTQSFTDYVEYIFHLGKEEFETGRMTMMYGTDYYDRFDTTAAAKPFNLKENQIQNDFDAMQHFYNASKCFNYILKNHPDYVFADYVKDELKKVNVFNNNLARTVANNFTKDITIK